MINTLLGAGLVWIYIRKYQGKYEWNPKIKATFPVAVFFFLSSLYLVAAPYIPPSEGQSVYEKLPYWLHAVVTWGVFGLGGIYWVIWTQLLPRFGGYKLVEKKFLVKMDSGEIKYIKFQKIVPRRKYSSKLKLQLKLKEINLSKKN